jgi:hypothetical protein
MTFIEMSPRKRLLTFGQFLSMPEAERKTLRSVEILPAQLGRPGFGGIVVDGLIPHYAPRERPSHAGRPRRQ